MEAAVNPQFAGTPEPPYYAVLFTSLRTPHGVTNYERMDQRLEELAPSQPGFLGIESARNPDGVGITISYWADEASIRAWKQVAVHAAAQRAGRETWYSDYVVRIARVERAYTLATSPREAL